MYQDVEKIIDRAEREMDVYRQRICDMEESMEKLLEEKDAEIQRLKEEVRQLTFVNGNLRSNLTFEQSKAKGGVTVQQIAEAFEKGAEAQYVCFNMTTMLTDDVRFENHKSEYLKQFEAKQRQEEGFKDFRIKELEKALRERGDLVPSTDEPQSLPRKEEGKDQPV
jgi:uncharacterized protein YigA (DUF484 family)